MFQLIISMDIMDGKCVRLRQGNFATKTIYADDPIKIARRLEEGGIKRLHVVDLDGARAGTIINLSLLQRITSNTSLTVDFGGGVKSEEDIARAFDAGAAIVTIGTIAVTEPEHVKKWFEHFGGDRIILGVDIREGFVAIKGWEELSQLSAKDIINSFIPFGLKMIMCTDIGRDGTMEGPSYDLYKNLVALYPKLQIIASGGVSSVDDLKKLKACNVSAAVVGKAFYEGRILLEDLRPFTG